MLKIWQRLPVVIRAVLAGAAITTAGTVPWALLASANMKYLKAVPWASAVIAVYLWFFWRFARGDGRPQSTSAARRTNLRANPVADEVWGAAILAGMLGLGVVVLVQRVLVRLVALPHQDFPDVTPYPAITVLIWLVTSAIVAGVVEETAFRGYMQSPIERRHGPVVAIVITGALFGFAHFSHPEVTLTLMPFYMTVGAVYGAMAYFTNSIYPSMVMHAAGNILNLLGQWGGGNSEWQEPVKPVPLIWETGADATFWVSVVLLVVVTAAAVAAFAALAGVTRGTRGTGRLRPSTA